MSDRKDKIIDFLEEAKKRGKSISPSDDDRSSSQIIIGHGNYQAGGDINVNKRVVNKVSVKPLPEYVTPAQKQMIKEKIESLVDIGVSSGGERVSLFPEWWTRLHRKFNVNSYHELNQDQYADVLRWLSQQKAISRPKLRRNDNEKWRNSLYAAIWSRVKNQIGQDKSWVYGLVRDRLGKDISSLSDLGERDLKSLYDIIMRMGR
jgi:hypothetical protein